MARTLVIMLLCLTGCDNFIKREPSIKYVDVYIEVPVLPQKPPIYEPIDLPIYYLECINPETMDIETAKAYYNSVIILIGEIAKREKDLDVYRNFKLEEK